MSLYYSPVLRERAGNEPVEASRDTKQWHKLIRLYVIICAMREWKNRIFSPGSRVIQQQLPPFSSDGQPMSTHDLTGTAESEQEVGQGHLKEEGRDRTSNEAGLHQTEASPKPVLFLGSVCVVFCFFITSHHRKDRRFTDFASDQFIFALENQFLF